jgi:hypothetical protein
LHPRGNFCIGTHHWQEANGKAKRIEAMPPKAVTEGAENSVASVGMYIRQCVTVLQPARKDVKDIEFLFIPRKNKALLLRSYK